MLLVHVGGSSFLVSFCWFWISNAKFRKTFKTNNVSVVLDVLVIKILITPFFNSLIICIFAPVVGLLVG